MVSSELILFNRWVEKGRVRTSIASAFLDLIEFRSFAPSSLLRSPILLRTLSRRHPYAPCHNQEDLVKLVPERVGISLYSSLIRSIRENDPTKFLSTSPFILFFIENWKHLRFCLNDINNKYYRYYGYLSEASDMEWYS